MAVLVTGLYGFLGSHLGRTLVARGHDVCAIVRPGSSPERALDFLDRVRVLEADLEQPSTYRAWLADVRPERAFHVAWYARHGSARRRGAPADLRRLPSAA